jgi:hypothetical protein
LSANLAQPWILARLSIAAAALALALISSIAAAKILAIPADSAPDERALRAERDSELAGAGLTLALLIELIGALATVLVAHRLSGSVRGAMCAYGVIASSPLGARAVLASVVAASLASIWLGIRAVDVRLARGSLSRTLAKGALVVTAAIAIDAASVGAFLLSIDLRQHASCCSTGAAERTSWDPGAHALGSESIGLVATVLASLSLLAIVAVRRRPSLERASLASASSAIAVGVGVAAARDVVAPFAFESPAHRCAYCLLRVSEATVAGPTLLIALALAAVIAGFTAGAAWVGRRSAARASSLDAIVSVTRWWIAAWSLALIAAWAPVIQYRLQSGTFALFGR